MRLGQTISDIRKERNMTQEEFAQIFHVTRQTVSNWEKEKNYPDLETLIFMSDEFNISLDVMLKEDKKMVKKLNKEITLSKRFKRNAILILVCTVMALAIGATGWGIAWNNAKKSLETKFNKGVEMNGFRFDEQLGYYKKMIDQESYYTLPNQSMPRYFDFVLHFYNSVLDYYTLENGDNIQIRWSGRDKEGKMEHSIFCLDEYGSYEYTFSEEQEKELCERNTDIRIILQDGEKIYESVYEQCDVEGLNKFLICRTAKND